MLGSTANTVFIVTTIYRRHEGISTFVTHVCHQFPLLQIQQQEQQGMVEAARGPEDTLEYRLKGRNICLPGSLLLLGAWNRAGNEGL